MGDAVLCAALASQPFGGELAMIKRLTCVLALVCSPALVLGQLTGRPMATGNELAAALCDADQNSREALLRTNQRLIDDSLWGSLIQRGATSYYSGAPQRS